MKKSRYEHKYLISRREYSDMQIGLSKLMELDSNCADGPYQVNSIYFDSNDFKSYYEKVDGSPIRNRFRIRYYNDFELLKLENKGKYYEFTEKDSVLIDDELYKRMLSGMRIDTFEGLLGEFRKLQLLGNIQPQVLIVYDRLSFYDPILDIRITFDTNVRAGKMEGNQHMVRCLENTTILEIKYKDYFPKHLKMALGQFNLRREEFSKYILAVDQLRLLNKGESY